MIWAMQKNIILEGKKKTLSEILLQHEETNPKKFNLFISYFSLKRTCARGFNKRNARRAGHWGIINSTWTESLRIPSRSVTGG